jgi:DNA processing protein
MESLEALVALNLIPGVGPIRTRQLLDHFGGDPVSILGATRAALDHVPGIGESIASAIAGWESTVDLAGEMRRIRDAGVTVLGFNDPDYPELLKQIYDPPLVLYVRGRLTPEDGQGLALVGSRLTTPYGLEVARKLAYQLAYTGVTVVSGPTRQPIRVPWRPKAGPSPCWARVSTGSFRPRMRRCSSGSPATAPW